MVPLLQYPFQLKLALLQLEFIEGLHALAHNYLAGLPEKLFGNVLPDYHLSLRKLANYYNPVRSIATASMRRKKSKHKQSRNPPIEISVREVNQLHLLFQEFPRLMTFGAESELRGMIPNMSERFWRMLRQVRKTNPERITPKCIHLVRSESGLSPHR